MVYFIAGISVSSINIFEDVRSIAEINNILPVSNPNLLHLYIRA